MLKAESASFPSVGEVNKDKGTLRITKVSPTTHVHLWITTGPGA